MAESERLRVGCPGAGGNFGGARCMGLGLGSLGLAHGCLSLDSRGDR